MSEKTQEQEQKWADWLALANEIGRQASATLDLDALLQTAVESIYSRFGYHDVLIALIDHETEEFVRGPRAGAYVSKAPPGARKPIDPHKGIMDWVALHGETVLANDVSRDPRYVALLPETRSELCVPIKRRDRVLAVLNIESRQPEAFDLADVAAMETLADYLAAALENARLYQEVSSTKAYLETILASSIDTISTTDAHGVLQYVSASAEKLTGYKPEELVGQPMWRHYVGGRDEARRVMKLLRRQGELRDYETQLWHRDGYAVPVSLSASLLKDDQGRVIGTVGVVKDIRGRRRLEQKLDAIYALGREMILAVDEEQIGEAVLEAAERVLQVPASVLARVDEERGDLQVVACRGFPDEAKGIRLPLSGEQGLIVAAAKAGELIYVPDTRRDPRYFDAGFPGLSDVAVPLKVRGKVIGVLNVKSPRVGAFDQDDLKLLSALADQAAIALENARLFKETKRLKAFNENIVQGVAEAILIEDAHGVLTFANPAAEALLGYSSEELVGLHWSDLAPDDEREKVRQEMAKRPEGIASRYETALLTKDGRVIPVIVSARPLFEDDKFIGVLSAVNDISERARAERQVRERRRYLEAVLGAAPDAIVTLDANRRIVEWNPGAERLFGYTREETIGRDIDELITNPTVYQEAVGLTGIVLGGDEVLPRETVRYRKDGTPVHVIVAGSPIVVDGELTGVVAVYTDITNRVRAEQRMAAVNRVARTASATLNLDELVEVVHQEIARVFEADAFFLALYCEEAGELDFRLRVDEGVREPRERRPLGPGLTASVVTSKEPVLIRDFEKEKDRLPPVRLWGTMKAPASWLGVPMLIGDRVVGVISVQAYRPRAYGEEEERLLSTIADQVAVAVENARLYEETRRRLAREERLNELAHAVGGEVELGTLIPRLLSHAVELAGADAASLAVLDPGRELLVYAYHHNLPDSLAGLEVPLGLGVSGYSIPRRESLVVDDYRKHPAALQPWVEAGVRSVINVPLVVDNQVMGVLALFSLDEVRPFGPEAVAAAEAAGRLAAVAIHRARLFEAEQRQRREAEALAEVAEALNQTLSLEEMLDIVLQAAMKFVGREEGSIILLDSKTNTVRVAASYGIPQEVIDEFNNRPVYAHEGTFGIVLQTGQLLEIPDAPSDPRVLHDVGHVPQQLTNVPLRTDEGVVGVIALDVLPRGDGERRLLLTLADLASAAIQRARLFEAQQHRASQLALISEVGKEVASLLGPETVMRRVPRLIRDAFDYYNVSYFAVDYVRRELVMEGIAGGFEELSPGEFRQSLDEGIIGHVARTGQSWLSNDVTKDPYYVKGFVGEVQTRSELSVPVKVGDRVVGVLDVQSNEPNAFDEEDLALMETLADRLAVSIQNARLFENAVCRRREAETLRKAALALSTSLDWNQVVERILAQLERVVPYDSASVQLLKGDRLEIVGGRGFPNLPGLLGVSFALDDEGTPNHQVVRTRAPLILDDAFATYEGFHRSPHAEAHIRSWLGVPMLVGERLIGMITLDKREPGFYTEEHARLAEAFAAQAAVAIQNARLFAEVERAKTEWETTFDAITDYIILLDPQMRIVRANRALAEKLGVSPASLIGRECRAVLGIDEEFCRDCPAAQAFRSGQAQVAELEQELLGGAFLISAYPLFDDAGNVRAVVQVMEDITERKRMQERLLQTEKLAAVGELVSGVAHELNNPLTVVLGYSQLLQTADVSDEVKSDLEKIAAQADRAARIVRNLLDFARTRPPEKKLTDVNDLLQRTLCLRAYELQVGNIHVQAELHPDLPWAEVDPYQMQQVFLNIVINAEQAMTDAHGKGTLRVSTRLVREGAERGDGGGLPDEPAPYILVSIADDGPGIPPEVLPRIFDPFFTTKEVGKGTGLGLSIAYGIVTGHGGSIWAESPNEWGGATLYVALPVAEEAPTEEPEEGEPVTLGEVAAAGRQRVLVVDDEEGVCDLLSRLLRTEGCHVEVALDGHEALRKLERTRYDLIICDIKMPGISGPELLRRIEQRDPELAKRVVFTTGDVVAPATRQFLDEIGCPYIPKPFDVQRVVALVAELIRSPPA